MLSVQCIAVELAGGDDPQDMRGATTQPHFLVDPEVLVDLDEMACGQNLDGVGVAVLYVSDGLRWDSHGVQLVPQVVVFSQYHHCNNKP